MGDSGLFWCPRCGLKAAVWNSDFDASDVGYDGEGLVTFFTCSNCGSEIEVATLDEKEDA